MIPLEYPDLSIWFKRFRYEPSPEQEAVHQALLKPAKNVDGPAPTLVILGGGEQGGKHLHVDTPVATPDGWTTMGELRPGDFVFDETGAPTLVEWTSAIKKQPSYRVAFDNGDSIIASATHPWLVQNYSARKHEYPAKVRTTQEMVDGGLTRQAPHNHRLFVNWSIDAPKPLQCPTAELPIEPYTLGVWLGDGHSNAPTLTCADLPIVDELRNKHIPPQYLRASYQQRLDLLRGLMDTDGYADKRGRLYFYNSNRTVIDGFLELVTTFGWSLRLREKTATFYGKDCGPTWAVAFQTTERVFNLPRKAERQRPEKQSIRSSRIYIKSIDPVGEQLVRCIGVSASSHLYLAGRGMVPTHNSWSAGMHIAARVLVDKLIWLVGDRYTDTRKEYEYCRDALVKSELCRASDASYAQDGPWELRTKMGHVIKTLSSEDVTKIAQEAPDGIVMCEPGRQTYDAFRAIWRRAVPRTAWMLVAGTFEGVMGQARWYPDLWREAQGDNSYAAKSLSLPSYANRSLYPQGANDPKFRAAVRVIKESNPVEGDEEVGERLLGIPRLPRGLVFSEFRRSLHVRNEAEFFPGVPVFLWVDPGYDPSAYAVLWVQIINDQVRVFDEIYRHRMINSEILTLVKNHPQFSDVSHVVIDVAAKAHAGAQTAAFEEWATAMREHNVTVFGQRVDLALGNARVHDKLRVSPITGAPFLVLNPRCLMTIFEFEEGYKLRVRGNGMIGSDIPVDESNHGIAAIRYGIMERFGVSDNKTVLPHNTSRPSPTSRAYAARRAAYMPR